MKDADNIKLQYHEQPRMLSFLWSVIADLFGDASKIHGRHNVSDKLRQLRELLSNRYSREGLIEFFKVNLA